MKKFYQTARYKAHSLRRARKCAKRRILMMKRIRLERQRMQGKSRVEQRIIRSENDKFRGYQYIFAPKSLCLISNPEATIDFINQIDSAFNQRKAVLIKLEAVSVIDYAAIVVLLSVMFRFKSQNIAFNGTMPIDNETKEKLVGSSFFKSMYTPFKKDQAYQIRGENILLCGNTVAQELGGDLIHAAARTIWGVPKKSPGMQRILLELMQNTFEHAHDSGIENEFWWMTVNHDRTHKKVSFGFVDYGQGIFQSLASEKSQDHKWYNVIGKIQAKFGEQNSAELLQKLLNGDVHRTVTGQHFRGKGIPGIKEVMDRNQVSSLMLISNDAFADVQKEHYKKLKSSFNGTFVYWELCYSNEAHVWNL